MGSSSSKSAAASAVVAGEDGSAPSSSSSSSGTKRARSIGARFWSSACLRLPKVMSDEMNKKENYTPKETGHEDGAVKSRGRTHICSAHIQNYELVRQCSNSIVLNGVCRDLSANGSNGTSSTDIQNAQMLAPLSRTRSPLDMFSDGIGFGVGPGPATRLESSDANVMFPRSMSIPNARGNHRAHGSYNNSSTRAYANREGATDAISSSDEHIDNSGGNVNVNTIHSMSTAGADHLESRPLQRRAQEPLDGTARFIRTLSVGRLRDRVLRRSFHEGRGASSDNRSLEYAHQCSVRRYLSCVTNGTSSDDNCEMLSSSSTDYLPSSSTIPERIHNLDLQTPQLREPSNHDMLEHRSAFLERRRRIRSQVRALQRLGSRFENLSGHERSCIASGEHRNGRCNCRSSSRLARSADDRGTRASISRIVMLAEALFEVLDEIHQQAVVLASRPSFSSIGSVPAPKEVVDCMPTKIYMKSQKHQNDEPTQCYICLLEYEDGDHTRILPCHHEFHCACVDKWLKEIHRVCPLCRGDVCSSDACPAGNTD